VLAPVSCHALPTPLRGPETHRATGGSLTAEGASRRTLCGRLGFVPQRSTVERPPSPHPVRGRTGEFPTRPGGARLEPTVDDVALARAGMLGQAWAHREMWYRFAPMVFAFLRRALGARHDHEDLLQEVFLRVFHRLGTLENPAALRSFVYSFAIRVTREELRRHRIRGRLAALFPTSFGDTFVPHDDFESRELLQRIQGALDDLPGRRRAIFVLRRFDGMELAEIAASLDLSLATVKRDLEKANAQIARAIHRDGRLCEVLQTELARQPAARGSGR
jgi:RNA polymerase sigma-70 factor (ECF subfamily)